MFDAVFILNLNLLASSLLSSQVKTKHKFQFSLSLLNSFISLPSSTILLSLKIQPAQTNWLEI